MKVTDYRSLQDRGCPWPECDCKVPDFAFSQEVRKNYCDVIQNPYNHYYGYKKPLD